MHKEWVIFFNDRGELLSFNAFRNKLKVTGFFPFTLYYGIVSAIPREWKLNLRITDEICDNVKRLTTFITHARCNKVVYNHFVNQKVSKPTAISKWGSHSSNTYFWSDIFTISFTAVRDPKAQYFQFRYIHRILGCNIFLFKIRKTDSPLCTFWHENCISKNTFINLLLL